MLKLATGVLALLLASQAADSKKWKTVKEVMEKTHKDIDGREPAYEVREGRGTEADRKLILDAYKAMSFMKPPRGDEKAWKAKTGEIVSTISDMLAKKPGAEGRINGLMSCRGCHEGYRPGGNK